MILIGGLKVRLKQVDVRTFACPRCGVDRSGRLMQARRWLTFFFVPLIPLKVLGNFVQCGHCDGQFDEAVLGAPTADVLADQLMIATRHGAAGVVRASANAPAARAAAIAVVTECGFAHDEDQLDVDLAGSGDGQTLGWLRHVAGSMSTHGTESFLARMASIALADGPIDDGERSVLESMGAALGMTPAHVAGVLLHAAQRSGSTG